MPATAPLTAPSRPAQKRSSTEAAQGWQALLERGLRSKVALLQSPEFKTTAQASDLLGIKEPAVRKRIRERKLFALRMPGQDEYRIPVWALDPALAGRVTLELLADLPEGVDEWQVYHALSTPAGALDGLRPFECLLHRGHLLPGQRAAREALAAHLQLPAGEALQAVVLRVVRAELDETGAAA